MSEYLRGVMATYKETQDLISIGAYKKGASKKIDEAVDLHDAISDLLCQQVCERFTFKETMELVKKIYDRRNVA